MSVLMSNTTKKQLLIFFFIILSSFWLMFLTCPRESIDVAKGEKFERNVIVICDDIVRPAMVVAVKRTQRQSINVC